MGEREIAARMLALLHEHCGGSGRTAEAILQWIGEHRSHFWPAAAESRPQAVKKGKKGKKRKRGEAADAVAWNRLPELAATIGPDRREPPFMAAAGAIAAMLAFDTFDGMLLRSVVAMDRCQRLARLRRALVQADADILLLFGLLAGAEAGSAAQRVRHSLPVALGLIEIEVNRSGEVDLDTHWSFDRLLDRGIEGDEELIEAMVGIRQQASLSKEDFADQRDSLALLVPLLARAAREGMAGVNLLIHGPPGTGKTEFARTLAAAAGLRLFAVGEVDEEGEEPSRFDRLHALKRAHRLLARRKDSALLFDEMEDLFSPPSSAGTQSRAGSKIFVNRLLEANAVPTIWTSNSIDSVDPAHLRRLSFVLKMDHPSTNSRLRMIERIAADEGFERVPEDVGRLARHHPETASIARAAFRTGRSAGHCPNHAASAARSLVIAMRGGGPLPPMRDPLPLDLGLFESDPPLDKLIPEVARQGAPADFSMLLSGAPGTGKTALAAHVAERIGRPLLVRRSSDLLSKWVGGTEANIAEAFAEAREEGAVLLFDEVDGLLADRSTARNSWEITQVNEMLTWMDGHDLPLIAATNHVRRLDPAALRRFLFKLELKELSESKLAKAFELFFSMPAPAALGGIRGLTPGDFALVARQCRFRSPATAEQILLQLAMEVEAKPGRSARIGF